MCFFVNGVSCAVVVTDEDDVFTSVFVHADVDAVFDAVDEMIRSFSDDFVWPRFGDGVHVVNGIVLGDPLVDG